MLRPDPATAAFEAQRPRLLRLAYRMLGSMSEAEDVVQDAWLRWRGADVATVQEPGAFLARTVARLCLDVMKSARARREAYVGPWLPEPLVEEGGGPDTDELTLTLMLALERLSPLERAAFLLHDVFAVPLNEVAAAVEREPAAVRQLAARARRHVQDARPRYPVAPEEGDRIARAFWAASRSGDVEALRAMLAEQVTARSDGGGKVLAFLNPVVGLDRVARLFAGLARKFGRDDPDDVRFIRIDGLPGYLSVAGGVLQATALEIEGGRIVGVYITRNPDKLSRARAVLAGATSS